MRLRSELQFLRLAMAGYAHRCRKSASALSDGFAPALLTRFRFACSCSEADYMDTTKHTGFWQAKIMAGNYIDYYGVRINRQGERIGYWLWDTILPNMPPKRVLVDAKDIIHLYEVERPGQIRGVPFSSSVMLRLRDLDDYEFTERIRNKIAACFTVFVEDTSTDRDPYRL